MPRKTNLSRITRNAKRQRLLRAQETDEERSARQAAVRERQRQVHKIKINTIQEMSIEKVRIENVRTLRSNTDKRESERDWLAAVKARMHSEKAWLNSIKDRLNSDKGRLYIKGRNVKNGLVFKPQNYVNGTLNCEMNQLSSEKDLSKSEMDRSNSERDPLNSVGDRLNSNPNLAVNAQPAQYLETDEVTIKFEVFDD